MPVTITGINFVPGSTTVTLSGISSAVSVSDVHVVNETTITAVLNTGSAEVGFYWAVGVTTPNGRSYWVSFRIDPPR